jgi:hypothetical protein
MSLEQQPRPTSIGEVLEYLGRVSLRQQPMVGLCSASPTWSRR